MTNSKIGFFLTIFLASTASFHGESNALELSKVYKYINLFEVFQLGEEGTQFLDQLCPNQINFDKSDGEESLKLMVPVIADEETCKLTNNSNSMVEFKTMRAADTTPLNDTTTLSLEEMDRRFIVLNNSGSNISFSCPLLNASSPVTMLAQDIGYVYTLLQYYNITGTKLGTELSNIPVKALQDSQDEYVLRLGLNDIPAVLCTYVVETVLEEINQRIEKIRQQQNMSTKPTPTQEDLDSPEMIKDPEDDGQACFPASALVQLKNGTLVSMENLKIGDEIRDDSNSSSKVLMFTHSDEKIISKFIHIESSYGEIIVSPSHYVYANGKLVLANTIQPGDLMMSVGLDNDSETTPSVVRSVKYVVERGLYNPQSNSGNIVIFNKDSGIVASCYTAAIEPIVGHSLLSPVRWINDRFNMQASGLSNVFNHGMPMIWSQ